MNEFERYRRQIAIPGFGEAGQRKLEVAHVVVAGVGGLGSAVLMYLAAVSVGHLTLIDAPRVEFSNLNRQMLHWSSDVERLKVESAIEKLHAINPSISIDARDEEITPKNIGELIRNTDIVVDGMDTYLTRYPLNEACVRVSEPFVHGAVEGLSGQLTTIITGDGPCLKCIIPKSSPTKLSFPVLGAAVGVIGCLQALEVIKLLVGIGESLVERMLSLTVREQALLKLKFTAILTAQFAEFSKLQHLGGFYSYDCEPV